MGSAETLVAKATSIFTYQGRRVRVVKGVTTVRAGHPILEGREHMFEPQRVDYDTDVEQATARPGEKRNVESPDTRAIREWATANGYEVSGRGKLPAEVVEAYREAHRE